MAKYSFIDFGNRDFIRNDDGEVVEVEAAHFQEVEDWLLDKGEEYGWTNSGVRYWNWNEESGEE